MLLFHTIICKWIAFYSCLEIPNKPMKFNSFPFIFFINSIKNMYSKLSSLCSHPLFSTILALCTLVLLYAPSFFLKIVLSPTINSTAIVLLSLLRLGANEKLEKESDFLEPIDLACQTHTHVECNAKMDFGLESNQNHMDSKLTSGLDLTSNQMNVEHQHESNSEDDYHKWEFLDTNSIEVVGEEVTRTEMDSKLVDVTMKFLEWNMKAPLEIIYEAYEGEEEDDDEISENNMITNDNNCVGLERYSPLSMYYPESETDSSSDGDNFPMNENFETHENIYIRWQEEENDREELIEISLDRYGKRSIEFCHTEEDNLIEIDIFTIRN